MTRTEAQSRVVYWAEQYGVPPPLALAVARRESGFDPEARGSSGEVGVMQLKPSTAADLGVDPYDPDDNIRGGVAYLARMYDQFGDWSLALSAYNAGPGATSSYGGVHPKASVYVSSVLAQAGMLPGGVPPEVESYKPVVQEEPEPGVNESAMILAGAALLFLLTD